MQSELYINHEFIAEIFDLNPTAAHVQSVIDALEAKAEECFAEGRWAKSRMLFEHSVRINQRAIMFQENAKALRRLFLQPELFTTVETLERHAA